MPFLESSLRSHFMSLQRTVKAAKTSSRVLGEVVGVKVRLYKEPTEWGLLQGHLHTKQSPPQQLLRTRTKFIYLKNSLLSTY